MQSEFQSLKVQILKFKIVQNSKTFPGESSFESFFGNFYLKVWLQTAKEQLGSGGSHSWGKEKDVHYNRSKWYLTLFQSVYFPILAGFCGFQNILWSEFILYGTSCITEFSVKKDKVSEKWNSARLQETAVRQNQLIIPYPSVEFEFSKWWNAHVPFLNLTNAIVSQFNPL